MKRWLAWLVLAAALCLCGGALAGETEAADLTNACKFKVSYAKFKYTQMTDKKYTTHFESNKTKQPWVEITAPDGEKIQGLYICFAEMPSSWELQVESGGDWVTAMPGDTRFMHAWTPLPEPASRVRLLVTEEKQTVLSVNELFALSEGTLPDWVQVWQPTWEKADILFLVAHPDDELIFLGGAIPTYAAEKGRRVVVVYLSRSNIARQSELLNGLWSMGLRNYPVWGAFRDHYPKGGVEGAYKGLGGRDKVVSWLTEIFRRYKPEVVVTQDVNGEYGHPQHKMIAAAAQDCLGYAASEERYPDSLAAYGPWQIKKLYLHLYPENQITMDWNVPLASMGGRTGLELADAAFQFHITQFPSGFNVVETGAEYHNELFGLAFTAVGPDVEKNDFLENIPLEPGE